MVKSANIGRLVGVQFADGQITARVPGEPEDPETFERVAMLLEQLREAGH